MGVHRLLLTWRHDVEPDPDVLVLEHQLLTDRVHALPASFSTVMAATTAMTTPRARLPRGCRLDQVAELSSTSRATTTASRRPPTTPCTNRPNRNNSPTATASRMTV